MFYIASFFLTHSAAVVQHVAKHSAAGRKCFCMNLAAPFIMMVPPFKAALLEALPYCDFLFGNESEALAFAEAEGWAERSVEEIALKVSGMPKASGHRARVVVFTQGSEATVVAKDGRVSLYPARRRRRDPPPWVGCGRGVVAPRRLRLAAGGGGRRSLRWRLGSWWIPTGRGTRLWAGSCRSWCGLGRSAVARGAARGEGDRAQAEGRLRGRGWSGVRALGAGGGQGRG